MGACWDRGPDLDLDQGLTIIAIIVKWVIFAKSDKLHRVSSIELGARVEG